MANAQVKLNMLPALMMELHLNQPFQVQYVYPHNFAINGVDSHGKIIVFSPDYSLAGESDYLFVYDGVVHGIMEMDVLKSGGTIDS